MTPAPREPGQGDAPIMQQVARQCSAVRHMATVLALMHGDFARMYSRGYGELIVAEMGERTARLMETLGDILNGMDAVTEDDDWVSPIFDEAHERWPTEGRCSHCGHKP